ncbi:hypothetical protein M9H77_07350 [Catharanthus roseus]|uniref:Uncharacterized protein n=1 Tax=Catharanthus roseus TaxID=4058 RepID=A0ACC0BUN7_CATRO|nr:hypothetical protein M9H77_07350 [Catharanthus roseus]
MMSALTSTTTQITSLADYHIHDLQQQWQPCKTRKYRSMKEIMRKARRMEIVHIDDDGGGDNDDKNCDEYSEVLCMQCSLGDNAEELLLCDKCDRGFHMLCLKPIVVRVPIGPWYCPSCSGYNSSRENLKRISQKKIIDFFGIQQSSQSMVKYTPQVTDVRRRRKRARPLMLRKKQRRLVQFTPTEDPARRLQQMRTLASALIALNMEFSNELTYMPGMAHRSSNQAMFENGKMQVLSKEDIETLESCRAMYKRGEYPPLMVVYDSFEGYTVEADGLIKELTLIAEYSGDVDYLKNREYDDCDSLMTLISAKDPSNSLVVCPDKRGNIARFINGVNNHSPESRKKKNLKYVRYNINGECHVLLVATRDIGKGERLYSDYNGDENEYPTHYFI